MDDEEKFKVRAAAAAKITTGRQDQVMSIFEMGDAIHNARETFATNKEFSKWCDAEVRLNSRTCNLYLQCADAIPDEPTRLLASRTFNITALQLATKPGNEEALKRALQLAPSVSGQVIKKKTVENIRREITLEERRSGIHEIPDGCAFHRGDFRTHHVAPPGSVDLVFTDPPFAENELHLYPEAAECGLRVLRPGGLFVTYAGKMFLDEIHKMLSEHLFYVWEGVVLHERASLVEVRGIIQESKALLIYRKPPLTTPWWEPFSERMEFPAEKTIFEWQQPLAEARHIIAGLCPPGGVVCDPMAGSGTVAVAALQLGMQFCGCEIDEARYLGALERIHTAINQDRIDLPLFAGTQI